MIRKTLSAMLAAAMTALTGSLMPAEALEAQPQEMTEREALEAVCAELGIEDYDAYLAELAARMQTSTDRNGMRDTCPYNPAYYIDIYTGGNSNGRIDSKDANYLLQFLSGQVNYPYVYNDLDPTHDYIIDRADVAALLECFSAVYILEVYPDFVPGTHGAANTTYVSENRLYYKYNAITGVYIGQYTLYSPPASATSMMQSTIPDRGVIGTDDRVVDNTRIGAVKIMNIFNDNNSWGSGCIIDTHTIITAAHIVYGGEYGPNRITQIRLFDNQGNRIVKTPNDPTDGDDFTPVEYHIPRKYMTGYYENGKKQTDGYDYAVITVQEDLSPYTDFSLGFGLDEIKAAGETVGVTGYPSRVNYIVVNNEVLSGANMLDARYYGVGQTCTSALHPNYMIAYTCDTSGNNSGSPLHYTHVSGSETQIGVHVSGGSEKNYATRINVDILHFCLNNPNLMY